MPRAASFHVLPHRSMAATFRHLATGARSVRTRHGVAFVRVLGTTDRFGRAWRFDRHRTAMFVVWHDDAALADFAAATPSAEHLRLTLLGGRGAWSSVPVLEGLGTPRPVAPGGDVVVLTRATVRLRHRRHFQQAARAVDVALAGSSGLLDAFGFGESPLTRLGTYSRWVSGDHVEAFLASDGRHVAAAARARHESWFAEELFARFASERLG